MKIWLVSVDLGCLKSRIAVQNGCEGDGNAGVGSVGGVVLVSACIGGTRGSGVLSSAGDVLEMSVVRGVGGV